jgi:excisionase family DNA binding protein
MLGVPKLLSVADVAEALALSKQTVYSFVQKGELRAYKIGQQFRIPEDAVMEFLQRSQMTAGQSPVARPIVIGAGSR